MTTNHATAAEPEIVESLLEALERAEEPVTVSQLRKGLSGPSKRSEEQIGRVLEGLVARGRAYRFAPYRSKAPRYWVHDLDHYARTAMLRRLGRRPIKAAELINGLKSPLKGCAPGRLRKILDELIRTGQAHKLPTFVRGRSQYFSARPPDPRDYLNDALDEISKKLEKAGISRAQVSAAALELLQPGSAPPPVVPRPGMSDEEVDRIVLDGLRQLAPDGAGRALVPIRELRKLLASRVPDKAPFDDAVIRLAAQGRVDLHRHDYPGSLGEDERLGMVPDGRGSYFIGIAPRG